MKKRARQAKPGEINGDLVDRFTLLHLLAGMALGAAGASVPLALGVGTVWEFVERPLKDRVPVIFPDSSQDTPLNAVGDSLAVALGCALARFLRGR